METEWRAKYRKQARGDFQEKQREETMDELRLEECYYLKKRPAGDEVYYWCDLDDHPCSKEYNDEECEEYNDQIKEEQNGILSNTD